MKGSIRLRKGVRKAPSGDKIFKLFATTVASSVFVILGLMVYELIQGSRLSIQRFGLKFLWGTTWDPAISQVFGGPAILWDEVKDDMNKSGASLSGGQQQRLCIARALAVEPEVLLMDEPCSVLDPAATAKIEGLIRTLSRDYTVVIVTHNMQQAARVSDFTAFLYLGELVEYGDTKSIFENPKNELNENYITGKFG